ncbi:hypothetical protein LNP74_20155 [Klebsiella pneumoniae subsp. pneumoniae]|nr:hypothetical protein [Klebsiella pneumoniae subsp. pneumoniae]
MITLCVEKRGVQTNMVYHGKQVALTYEIPMAGGSRLLRPPEVHLPRLCVAGLTTSNASRRRNMVRVDVLINGERVRCAGADHPQR